VKPAPSVVCLLSFAPLLAAGGPAVAANVTHLAADAMESVDGATGATEAPLCWSFPTQGLLTPASGLKGAARCTTPGRLLLRLIGDGCNGEINCGDNCPTG